MKTVVTGIVLGIVFSIALIFVNRAFASDASAPIKYLSPVAIHALMQKASSATTTKAFCNHTDHIDHTYRKYPACVAL